MNQSFHVIDEDFDSEFTEYDFAGVLKNCKIDVEKTFEFTGVGHLYIFVIRDDEDESICNVEV